MPISPSDRSLADLLVARDIITLPQLDEVTQLAETWNVALTDAVLSRAWMPPARLYQGLAYHYDLPFAELVNDPPDQTLLRAEDLDFYVQRLTMPWRRQQDGRLLLATANPGPETVLAARQRFGPQIEFAVASKFGVLWAVQGAFDSRMSRRAVFELADRDPALSARDTFTVPQVVVLFALLTAVLAGLAFSPLATLVALNVAMGFFYLGNFLFKGILVSVGGGRSIERDVEIEIAARALRDEELPVFTVLVPMFREARMLPRLAEALRQLDYPLGKLDIKIVLEAEDTETIEVARNLGLEGVFEIIRVPPSQPQTKPKACNFALRFARGEYLVIYDAEDRPEPDQLRKVVETFRRSPPNTACLHAG
jgi:hypothetical protein